MRAEWDAARVCWTRGVDLDFRSVAFIDEPLGVKIDLAERNDDFDLDGAGAANEDIIVREC